MLRFLTDQEIKDIVDYAITLPVNITTENNISSIEGIKNNIISQLKEVKVNEKIIDELKKEIKKEYERCIVNPGEMVGPWSSQSIGENGTQMSVPYETVIRLVKVCNGAVEFITTQMGKFCDDIIDENKDMTRNTGHKDSVETSLEKLKCKYYIIGVDGKEQTKWNEISHVSKHKVNGDLLEVVTSSGRTTSTTLAHSHLTRKDQTVKPILASELKIGMRIPVARYIENKFEDGFVIIGDEMIELDWLFGWFIGAYLAEGNINGKGIFITNVADNYIKNTEKIAERFDSKIQIKDCLKNIINIPGWNKPNKLYRSVTTTFTHRSLANFLVNTCGTGSYIKRVPNFAFTAPNIFKSGLIQGYIDGDGNMQYRKGSYCGIRSMSVSKELSEGICLMFSYFNIYSTIHIQIKNSTSFYWLNVSGKYGKIYKEKIGSVKFKNILDKLSDDYNCGSDYIDQIPNIGSVVAHCGKVLKLPGQSRTYGICERRELKGKYIGRETLKRYTGTFSSNKNSHLISDELKLLNRAIESTIIWDEIKELKRHTPDQNTFVYDFTVPDTQSFMVDTGIIVHNTLKTFHSSGISSKNITLGVPRFNELISVSSNPAVVSLTIYYNSKPSSLSQLLKEDNNTLKEVLLKDLVINFSIFNTQQNKSWYFGFNNLYNTDYKNFNWCLSLSLNVKKLYDNKITPEMVSNEISKWTQLHCVFSPAKIGEIDIYIDMAEVVLEENAYITEPERCFITDIVIPELYKIKVSGIKGIKKVFYSQDDKKTEWRIETEGSNFLTVLGLPNVDNKRTTCDSVWEIYNTLGIEAARAFLISEMNKIICFDGSYVDIRHTTLLVDSMTKSGTLRPISRHGIDRDVGPMAKASFEEGLDNFLKAGAMTEVESTLGVSSSVMIGKEGKFGTNLNSMMIDMDFYKEKRKKKKEKDDKKKELIVDTMIENFVPFIPEYNPSMPEYNSSIEMPSYNSSYTPSSPVYNTNQSFKYEPSSPVY